MNKEVFSLTKTYRIYENWFRFSRIFPYCELCLKSYILFFCIDKKTTVSFRHQQHEPSSEI